MCTLGLSKARVCLPHCTGARTNIVKPSTHDSHARNQQPGEQEMEPWHAMETWKAPSEAKYKCHIYLMDPIGLYGSNKRS